MQGNACMISMPYTRSGSLLTNIGVSHATASSCRAVQGILSKSQVHNLVVLCLHSMHQGDHILAEVLLASCSFSLSLPGLTHHPQLAPHKPY